MKKIKIFLSREATRNLENYYYFFKQLNPTAASKWLDGIEEAITELSVFPKKGAVIPEAMNDKSLSTLRQILFSMSPSGNTFRIIYQIQGDSFCVINIVTIRNSRQKPYHR